MSDSSVWSIDWTTNSGQSGPGIDGNKGVLCIPQSSSITEASPADCLVSYQNTLLSRDAIGVFLDRL